ncbi:MAG: hypothetical protein ABIH04_02165 [Planctomycetota bacterium]
MAKIKALTLNPELRLLVQQLAYELKYAAKSLSKKEWLALFVKTLRGAGIKTVKPKINGIKSIGRYLSKKTKMYINNPKRVAVEDALRIKKTIAELPKNIRIKVKQFQTLSTKEKCESALVAAISLLIFFAAMGGMDAEGGLPDLDIKIGGIGFHRHWSSHSIVLGFGIEFALRFILLFLLAVYSQLPETHHSIWDSIRNIVQKTEKYGIAAVWMAVGAHLFKDASLFSGSTKPVVGLFGSHSMEFHQSFFATNAAVAEAIGIKSARI